MLYKETDNECTKGISTPKVAQGKNPNNNIKITPQCNTPIFNISLLVLLLDDIHINIINSIDMFDIINLIIRIY